MRPLTTSSERPDIREPEPVARLERGFGGLRPTLRRLVVPVALTVAYLAAYVVVTWPWPVQLWTQARSNGDTAMFAWTFWWMRHEVEALSWPFGTQHVLAPMGGSLIFHGMQLTALVSVPVQWLVGTILAFNLMTVLLALLGGVATYALARDLGMPRIPAVVAGFLFVASPHFAFRYHASGHTNLAHAFWIPLLLLVVRRYFRERSTKNAMLVATTAAGSVYSDLTMAIFASALSAGYAVAVLLGRRIALREFPLRSVLVAMATFAILVAPFAVELLRVALRDEIAPAPGLGRSWLASLDLGLLLVPHLAREGPGALGIAAPALAVLGAIAFRRRRVVLWLVAVIVVCIVLGLGPELTVFGNRYVPVPVHLHDDPRPASALMPWTWVQGLMPHLRGPKRLMIIAAVPLALLGGFAIAYLLERRRTVGVAVIAVALPVALMEARIPIRDVVDVQVPALYQPIARDTDESAIVVDVPLGFRTGLAGNGAGLRPRGTAYIYALQHEKPIAVGFFPRMPRARTHSLARLPLYRDIIALQELEAGAPLPTTAAAEGRASALEYNLKYVVMQQDVPGRVPLHAYLTEAGYELIDSDGTASLYRLAAR